MISKGIIIDAIIVIMSKIIISRVMISGIIISKVIKGIALVLVIVIPNALHRLF